MKSNAIKSLLIGFFSLLSGCSQYHSKPLTEQAIQQQLQTPSREQLTIQAAKIKHPLLEPVKFDMEDGLSPDETAILAVLRNPQLHAIRDQHAIANAQLLQAGLLPLKNVNAPLRLPGEWMKPISKSRANGFICIEPLINSVTPLLS
jgi:hypothetical protein